MDTLYTESELADMEEDTSIPSEEADVCEAMGRSFDECEDAEWNGGEYTVGDVTIICSIKSNGSAK